MYKERKFFLNTSFSYLTKIYEQLSMNIKEYVRNLIFLTKSNETTTTPIILYFKFNGV